MSNDAQNTTLASDQSKILSVRLPPQIYSSLKTKTAQFGLKPSTFIKYAIISMLMNSQFNFKSPFEAQFSGFLNSLPQQPINEEDSINLVNQERKKI
jgi:hypothetical protein